MPQVDEQQPQKDAQQTTCDDGDGEEHYSQFRRYPQTAVPGHEILDLELRQTAEAIFEDTFPNTLLADEHDYVATPTKDDEQDRVPNTPDMHSPCPATCLVPKAQALATVVNVPDSPQQATRGPFAPRTPTEAPAHMHLVPKSPPAWPPGVQPPINDEWAVDSLDDAIAVCESLFGTCR